MRLSRLALINVLAIVAAAGCRSPGMNESMASADTATPPVHPDKARICVLRISSGLSMASAKVRDGDRKIGALRQNTYLCWEREPGEAIIRSSWVPLLKPIEQKEDIYELHLTVEAGKVYYLMQQWRTAKPLARLAVLDGEYAREKLAQCKRVTISNPNIRVFHN